MAIRDWHRGQLGVTWVAGLLLGLYGRYLVIEEGDPILGWGLILGAVMLLGAAIAAVIERARRD